MKQASSQQLQKKHLVFIDYLRAFSCIAVVFLHIIVSWSEKQGLTVDEYPLRLRIDTSIAEVLRVAVPIFIMISGALLLDKDKEITWSKIKKYILKMLLVLATFGFGFAIIESVMNNGLNIGAIIEAGKNLLEENTWGHMWYIYMLIGLYILTPILKAYTDKANKKDFSTLINVLTVLTIIIPSINWLTKMSITTFYIKSASCVYYYLLGQYVMRYTPRKKYSAYGLIVATVALLLLGFFTDHHLTGNKYNSLPLAMLAVSIVSLAKYCNMRKRNLIIVLSKNSFGIYILHVVFIHLYELFFKIRIEVTYPVVGEISLLLLVLVPAIFTTAMLKKIPILKRLM